MCSNTFPAVCACADVCARVVCLHKWQVCLRVSVCVCVCVCVPLVETGEW